MLNANSYIKDIENIINYHSKPHTRNKHYKRDTQSDLGILSSILDRVCKQMNSENIESAKEVIEKVAEANRAISLPNSHRTSEE